MGMNPFEIVVILFTMAMVVVELALVFFAVRATINQFREDKEREDAEIEHLARKDYEENE